MTGKIIVIEGTDCSGKETQSKLLVEKLKSLGKKCAYFSFPMYDTPTGKIVGGAYLGKPEICEGYFKEGAPNVDPKVSCLYYAADRKYNIDKVKQYIEDGYYVILDRYTSSNMAHQGCKILDKDEIKNIAQEYEDVDFVYPVHMNPVVRDTVYSFLGDEDNVKLIESLDVLDMHNLISRSYMVMTDSGGLQEEAPAFGKPVLVLRTETKLSLIHI